MREGLEGAYRILGSCSPLGNHLVFERPEVLLRAVVVEESGHEDRIERGADPVIEQLGGERLVEVHVRPPGPLRLRLWLRLGLDIGDLESLVRAGLGVSKQHTKRWDVPGTTVRLNPGRRHRG